MNIDCTNNIVVTTESWSGNGWCNCNLYIEQVSIYRHHVVFSYARIFHNSLVVGFGVTLSNHYITKIIAKNGPYSNIHNFRILDPETVPYHFMYDRFLFIVQKTFNVITCYQPDTKIETCISIPQGMTHKEFELNSLCVFIKLWHQLPFGSKRAYDPQLMEWPEIICSSPKEVIPVSCKSYYDLLIVCG